jgi:hypothetical protein
MMGASAEDYEGSTGSITDEQIIAAISAPEPRMAALAISNDALRDSLRPAVPPSIGGWINKTLVNPWWRYVEYGYTEVVCWLWARAPWQRWALSSGLGAVLGLGVVVAVAPRFRPELERIAAASGDSVVASTQLAAASSMVIAPLRPEPPAAAPAAVTGVEPPVAAPAAVTGVEPPLAADVVAVSAPDAPMAMDDASEQVVEEPADAPELGKSKKKGRGHGRRRAAKPKSASSLSQLFRSLHRASPERTAP